jgi:ParB family chromosome partitioning protein
VTERRSVGDEVLEDLDALMKSGDIGKTSTSIRSVPSPARLGREMLEGAAPTIARQRETIQQLEAERRSGMVVLRLDPKRVQSSTSANRHQLALLDTDPKFVSLKRDIREMGQLDPARVRPVDNVPGIEYEIVYGHRRHAVALALDQEAPSGWPLLALLDTEAKDARKHVLRMHSENYARLDLSPFEYGRMYASWLSSGSFKDQTDIAEAIGLDQSMVSTYLAVGGLPDEVLAAFGDPRTISVRWARELRGSLKAAKAKVLTTAEEIAARPGPRDPAAVLRELVQAGRTSGSSRRATKTETVKLRGKTLYTLSQSGGRLLLKFGSLVDGPLAGEARDELKEHLTAWLGKRVKP